MPCRCRGCHDRLTSPINGARPSLPRTGTPLSLSDALPVGLQRQRDEGLPSHHSPKFCLLLLRDDDERGIPQICWNAHDLHARLRTLSKKNRSMCPTGRPHPRPVTDYRALASRSAKVPRSLTPRDPFPGTLSRASREASSSAAKSSIRFIR